MNKHRQTAEAALHLGPHHNDLTQDPMATLLRRKETRW